MKRKTLLLLFTGLHFITRSNSQNVFPANGNAGIGTVTPSEALTIQSGNVLIPSAMFATQGNLYFGGKTNQSQTGMRLFGGDVNGTIRAGFIDVRTPDLTDGLRFRVDSGSANIERMRIAANGNVTIGSISSTPSGYRLFVEQGVLTEKVKVALRNTADWADHVFSENHNLLSLEQTDAFIRQHKHLPGIPSAEEMVKNGNNLGETDARLLAKIEELTLHMISLNQQLQQVKKENEALRLRFVNLKCH